MKYATKAIKGRVVGYHNYLPAGIPSPQLVPPPPMDARGHAGPKQSIFGKLL